MNHFLTLLYNLFQQTKNISNIFWAFFKSCGDWKLIKYLLNDSRILFYGFILIRKSCADGKNNYSTILN